MLAHYPLNHHPARTAAEDIFRSITKHRPSALASALGSALFVSLSAAVAVAVPDLGSVLHLIGGTAAAFIIFFLPGLLLVNAAIVKHTASSVAGSFTDLQALVEGRIRGRGGEGGGGEGGGGGGEERGGGGEERGGGQGLRASLLSSARRRASASRARRFAVAAARRASSSSSNAAAAAVAPSPLRRTTTTASSADGGGNENGGDQGFELDGDGVGIKRVGLIYSPRKSWWAGVALVALAVAIWSITILTAIVPFRE